MVLRAVTFDVYSALFDIITGLAGVVALLLQQRSLDEDPKTIAQTWRQKHMEYLLVANSLDREPASNRRAIEASAGFALRRLRPPLTAAEVEMLVTAWEHLPPWPEAADVLRAVRKRSVILGALSNGDEGMLRALLGVLPVEFDIISSTEGGRFKPHPTIYKRTLDRLGVRVEELLHVAGSPTDSMGAKAAGITTVWVNRTGDPVVDTRFTPAYEVADLRGILSLIDAL